MIAFLCQIRSPFVQYISELCCIAVDNALGQIICFPWNKMFVFSS
uniref:Uncharacterized protein n=1 Tax=Anguilla anguilla TaxID=7936 RepID=A0A0E9T0H5_ANGAN